MLDNLPRRNAFEVEALAAREYGGQHFMHIRRRQHKNGIARRLLQRLEQRVDIGRSCGCYLATLLAHAARLAIDRIGRVDSFGKQAGGAGLASAAWSGEKIGMCWFAAAERIFERAGYWLLPD